MLIQQQQRFQSQLLGLRSVSSPPVRAPVRLLSLTPLLLEMSRLENDEEGSTTLVVILTISQMKKEICKVEKEEEEGKMDIMSALKGMK